MPELNPDQFDYRINHQPPGDEDNPRLHDLSKAMPDVYEHPEYYDHGQEPVVNRQVTRVMRQARGNPEHMVDMYRGAPHGITHINTGDWVTTSPEYARQHGLHEDDPAQDWPVYHAKVPAKHLGFGGNDLIEYGYHGPTVKARKL